MAGLEEARQALERLRKLTGYKEEESKKGIDRRWIIYKITSKNSDKIYIGSDHRNLEAILKTHIMKAEKYERLKCYYLASYEILKLGGIGIDEIEVYNCNKKIELLEREEEYIKNNLDICVNIVSPLDNNKIIGRNKSKIEKDIARRKLELEKFIANSIEKKIKEGYNISRAKELAKEEDMKIMYDIDDNLDMIYSVWMSK